MLIDNSDVTLIWGTIWGADRWSGNFAPFNQPARPAAVVNSGNLILGPRTQVMGGASQQVFTPAFDVPMTGTGRVHFDRRTVFSGMVPGNRPPIPRTVHAVRNAPLIRNEPYVVDVFGPTNGVALIAAGNALLSPFPTPLGALLIDPCALLLLGFGPLTGSVDSVRFTFSCPLGLPIDHLFAFQAAVLAPDGTASLTLPSRTAVAWETGRNWP